MIHRDPFGCTQVRGHHRQQRGPKEQERHFIGAIITAVAVAVTTYAASESAAQQREYAAEVEERRADAAKQAASIAAENQEDQDRRLLAAQRARLGLAGVEGSIGSPLLAEMESAETAELNRRRILYAGDVQAQGYEAEAKGERFAAKATRRLGYLQAGTSLITGGAKAWGAYSGGGGGGDAGYSTSQGYQTYRRGERYTY